MKRLTYEQRQREWFRTEVGRRLVALGAIPGGYDYALTTAAGNLYVSPYDGWIACRFEEPERAIPRGGARLNHHSGKWNHVYAPTIFQGSRQQAQTAVDDFFCKLSVFLPPPT